MRHARMFCGRVFISLEQTYPLSSELGLLRHPDCCGVVLFRENCQGPEQIADLCNAIRAVRKDDLFIAIDQEGGRVQRLSSPFTDLPAQANLGRYYHIHQSHALKVAAQLGWLRSAELRAVGIDFSFAPVIDLHYRRSKIIGDRAISRKPDVSASIGTALMQGAHDAGAIAVAKHFPGHGYALADSHTDPCVDDRGYAEIEFNDLHPFASLVQARIDAVMSAHILFPQCDKEIVSYSSFWARQVLRERLGFRGLLFSDDLTMLGAGAGDHGSNAPGDIAERALNSLAAGHDAVLVCRSFDAAEACLHAVARSRGRGEVFKRLLGRPVVDDMGWSQLVALDQYQRARASLHTMSEALKRSH